MKDGLPDMVRDMKLGGLDPRTMKRALKNEVKGVEEHIVTVILGVMSLIEVVCYVIFFCVKRHTTGGFKKID
jgi:hypothetical protein